MGILNFSFYQPISGVGSENKPAISESLVPRIFEKDGYQFFFYSNEHPPIHVHVRFGGGEAVFMVSPEAIELRESAGMKVRELSKAEDLANEHKTIIIECWNEHITRQS